MKRILFGVVAALMSVAALAVPISQISPTNSTSGQAIVSTGPTTAPAWSKVTATALAAQAANTVVANATGSSASPTAFAMPSCSGTSNALTWLSGTGFGCNGVINALTLGGANFAAPGAIGSTTASTGAFTTLAASSTVSGTGFSTYLASPPAIGGTTPAAGTFTALKGNSLAKVYATKTSAQSLTNGAATTITSWTTGFDANSNFTASTGTFTAPATGYYLVSAQVVSAAVSIPANTVFSLSVTANSSVVAGGQSTYPTASGANTSMAAQVNVLVSLTSGQTVTIAVFHNEGSAVNTSTGAAANYLSITQVP